MLTQPTAKDQVGVPLVQRWEAVARNEATILSLLAQDERLDSDTRDACAGAFLRQCTAHGITLPNDD